MGHFGPPGSESGSGSTDPIESGSNSDPDPQPTTRNEQNVNVPKFRDHPHLIRSDVLRLRAGGCVVAGRHDVIAGDKLGAAGRRFAAPYRDIHDIGRAAGANSSSVVETTAAGRAGGGDG